MPDNPPTATSEDPIRVLFLCTGNSARSQIAEALLQKRGKGRFVAGSAGIHPADRVHPDAVALLAEQGIDWSGRQPKNIEEVADQQWDLIITVCDRAKETCPIFPGRPLLAHWGVEDPAAVEDPEVRQRAFDRAASILVWRMDLMLALPHSSMHLLVTEQRLQAIGRMLPSSEEAG